MKCIKCGTNLGESDVFCPSCGAKVTSQNNVNNVEKENAYNYERNVNAGQSYNGQQQSYGQYNNYGQQNPKSKNAGDIVKICVCVIIAVAILVGVAFGGYFVFSSIFDKDNENNNQSINDNNASSSVANNNNNSGTSGTLTNVSNKQSSSYKVNYGGFKLYIPDNLIYEMDYVNNALNIGDQEQTWIAQMQIQEGSYQQLKQNRSYLSTYFMQYFNGTGATASSAMVETIDGIEYILLECSMAGENVLVGFTGLNSMYAACFVIYNEDNDFDRNTLKNLSSIITTAEYSGAAQYMESNNNMKMEDIKKIFEETIKKEDAE